MSLALLFVGATLIPPTLVVEPTRPYVDLGPVLIADDGRDAKAVLLGAANKFGADAILQERRSVEAVYSMPDLKGASRAVVSVAALLMTGMNNVRQSSPTFPTAPVGRKGYGYYRLLKYAKPDGPALAVSSKLWPHEFVKEAQTKKELGPQLEFAHQLFLSGKISPKAYEKIRTHFATALEQRG